MYKMGISFNWNSSKANFSPRIEHTEEKILRNYLTTVLKILISKYIVKKIFRDLNI